MMHTHIRIVCRVPFPILMLRIFVSFLFGVINHDQVSVEGRGEKIDGTTFVQIHLVTYTNASSKRSCTHTRATYCPITATV